MLTESLGATPSGRTVPGERSEVQRLVADSTKARRLLHWRPEFEGVDGLERGLRETVAWLTRPENLSRYKAERYNV